MYSVSVSDHFMIAHSFKGDVFGPAQRLHGATYGVEVELKRARLDANGIVVDIGAFRDVLREILAALDFRNLDEEARFAGVNTTTEVLSRHVFDAMQARIQAGDLGPDAAASLVSMRVLLRESPVAYAAYEAPLA